MNHNRSRPIERLHRWPRGDPLRRAGWEGEGRRTRRKIEVAKSNVCGQRLDRFALRNRCRESAETGTERKREREKERRGGGGGGRRASKFRDGLKPRCGQAPARSISTGVCSINRRMELIFRRPRESNPLPTISPLSRPMDSRWQTVERKLGNLKARFDPRESEIPSRFRILFVVVAMRAFEESIMTRVDAVALALAKGGRNRYAGIVDTTVSPPFSLKARARVRTTRNDATES